MTLIYVIFTALFMYMAYGAGNYQNVSLTLVYIIGAIGMGFLAGASSQANKKAMEIRMARKDLDEGMKKILESVKKENQNGTVIND